MLCPAPHRTSAAIQAGLGSLHMGPAFCVTDLMLSFTPGPAVLLVVSAALSRGARPGLAASLVFAGPLERAGGALLVAAGVRLAVVRSD